MMYSIPPPRPLQRHRESVDEVPPDCRREERRRLLLPPPGSPQWPQGRGGNLAQGQWLMSQ